MADLDPQLVALLAVLSGVVALVALVLVVVLAFRLRTLRREQQRAVPGAAGEDLGGVLGRLDDELAVVRRDLVTVHTNTEHLRELLRSTVSRVGLVRYDAFDDMGGALSFSAALLDERGDGVVVSAINGRTETRCYAKPVADGRSEHDLSREEEAAVETAIERRASATLPPSAAGRRRRRAS
jgi:hypothetical protein